MKKFIIFAVFLVLCGTNISYSKNFTDPTSIGMNAKVISLGRANTALANDCASIISNPAGLSHIYDWQMTSMSSKLVGDVNYLTFAGALNTKAGAIGFGIIKANVSDIPNTIIANGNIVTSGTTTTYDNSAYLITYAKALKKGASIGATLKLFSQNLNNNIGSGYGLDLGLQYQLKDWLNLGLNGQNLISSKLSWAGTNTNEDIPSVLKLGAGIKLMGQNSLISKAKIGELALALDMDLNISDKSRPGTSHVGFEWWPVKQLAFRAGVDQVVSSKSGGGLEIASNNCLGVGILAGGVEFSYAYLQQNGISGNETHYFSISYVGAPPEKKEVVVLKVAPPAPVVEEEDIQKFINFTSLPKSNTVYTSSIKIGGVIKDSIVKSVEINARKVDIKDNKFTIEVPLLYGKNPFNMVAYDDKDNRIASLKGNIVRLRSFKDVKPNYFARDQIEYLSTLGVIAGFADNTFKPDKPLTRAELCTLAVKLYDVKLLSLSNIFKSYDANKISNKNAFKDIPNKYWAERAINICVSNKWISGYPDKTFKPNNPMTRAEAVIFISKYAAVKTPLLLSSKPFPDVSINHWAARSIAGAKAAGLLKYLDGKTFKLDYKFRRGEAADVMSRTGYGITKIKDMLGSK